MIQNWVDIVILVVLLFYSFEGYALGALPAFFDFLQFITSFFVGLKLYGWIGSLLSHYLSLPQGIANAIGFFIAAFLAEMVLHLFLSGYIQKVTTDTILKKPEYQKLNNILGIVPGILSGLVLIMFLLTVITALPVTPYLKNSITSSNMGGFLVARSQVLEKQFSTIFGGAASETLNFLTVEPESNAMVQLHFTYSKGTIDQNAEGQMLQLLNQERISRGLNVLTMDNKLQAVARSHAQDMLERGYFSHYTPEGLTPFDRMDRAGITYTAAGENLAFSPNVQLAMQGLMQSPGHRANILSKDYGKVGVGVVDSGIYGQMFVQEFTN